MSFLKNTVSLLALLCVMPAANAATARPSVLNAANVRRMPTLATYTGATTGTAGTVTSGTTTAATLLANAECIDAYTACIKGGDACGSNFEECTTNVLFHGKMPMCLSTLSQCESAGVNSLFGTSNISALSNVATKNTYGEITEYTYPTAGSVLGQMISAAAIENMYDTSNCVRRYSSCLRKDSVCGADFELCTTNAEFKKQAVFCDSTLARCAGEGKNELFGNAGATSSTVPTASSRIGEMIAEGAALAAVNAVSTCYKVVDQCILNACAANPYKCYEDSSVEIQSLVESINNGTPVTDAAQQFASDVYSKQDVRAYVKNACESTIGSNKYCYATFLGDGVMPTASQLRDEDNVADIFDQAYSARMNSSMNAKITELVNKFDTRAKEKCVETITSCAMRSCGGGSGAACYSLVFSDSGKNSINGGETRDDIKTACQAVVNTDANCLYAAKNPNSVGTYNYSFIQADAFETLFPEYDDGAENDPIGVVASLNAKLSTSYNDAAIAQMKKRCQSVATSCVKSMCGADYVNCYRNRTDIYSSLTNTDNEAFDKSMNKVGGVLDYTIVLGLCVDTVKNADVCAEHLKIEQFKLKGDKTSNVWGGASDVHGGWLDAGQFKLEQSGSVQMTDEYGNNLCSDKCNNYGVCDTSSNDSSCGMYENPVMISEQTWAKNRAADTLFRELIYDLEIEAQAKYNAKLTKQQNMCMSSNNGGILGKDETGSTFMWAKLRGSKVPSNYTVAGLKPNQFVASNDLYGSFCRVRVTLQSDDKYIQDKINSGANWSTAYFAAGDTFTCGSWIPNDELEELANAAGTDARTEKENSQYGGLKWWTTAIGALGGGVGGAYLGRAIYDGDVFGGLSEGGKPKKQSFQKNQEDCKDNVDRAIRALNTQSVDAAYRYALKAEDAARNIDILTPAWPKGVATSESKAKEKKSDGKYYCGTSNSSNEERVDCVGDKLKSDVIQDIKDSLNDLREECREQTKQDEDSDDSKFGPRGAAGIGAGVTAIAGGALGYLVVDQIQKQELSAAEQAAIKEFMDNVGSKIRCFVGPDEVGMYGDMISTSME